MLTKAALADDVDAEVAAIEVACPGLDVLVTSVLEGSGIESLRAVTRDRTVTMLGESGAGKSSLVNALVGDDACGHPVGAERRRQGPAHDHRTRAVPPAARRCAHRHAGDRGVGLWADPDAVAATFTDIDDLAPGCRFRDCRHDAEPGCAVRAAVDAGELAPERLDSWHSLQREVEAAALRAHPREQRRANKRFGRMTKEAKEAAQDKRR